MGGARLAGLMLGAWTMLAVSACAPSPPSTELARLRQQGEALYERFACGSCHGARREGRRTAPPLLDLDRHWDQGSLEAYLQDPSGVTRRTPRLRFLSERYIADMPHPPGASQTDLATLAAYLLADDE